MLLELTIRNFAIIEDLNIRFNPGLTILSGETGAGKSIIINAVNLLLGSRVSASMIRTGADSAELEALFEIPANSAVAATMNELGYDASEGLLVRRIISSNDRHRIYLNGRLGTMQALSTITANLASISGQHAHQGLLKEDAHLLILDQFGDLVPHREAFAEQYSEMLPLIRKEHDLLQSKHRQSEQSELLKFQQQEIQAAAIARGEDESLEKQCLRLKNSEMLYQSIQQCTDVLYAGEGAVVEHLGEQAKALEKAAQYDERLATKAAELADLAYGVEDLAAELRDHARHIETDPQLLEKTEARLDLLNKLKRKYGGTLEAILAHEAQIAEQLEALENVDAAIERLRAEMQRQHARLCRMATDLSAKRSQVAKALSRQVENELSSLKMSGTRFAVALQQQISNEGESSAFLTCSGHTMTESGMDRATFMIAPNVGEGIKPLASIASGGELSRVVLALKAILAQSDAVETVVFDEVDAGIGGGVAEVVGQKLAGLARHHQVLCITHLPQIAKYGDHHFRIDKRVDKGRTRTTISLLSPDERVEEIARMLGGEHLTATTLEHAREMLGTAASKY